MQNYIFTLSAMLILLMTSCSEQGSQASVTTKPAPAKQIQQQTKLPTRSNQTSIQLTISSVDVKKGEEACVSLMASDFDGIMAYQHSINFDPSQLQYVSAKNFGLPHLSEANFGATKAAAGSINFLWYDMNVKGISVADKTKVFDLCFKALAEKGSSCKVKISDTPIKMEVVGPQKQKLQLKSSQGEINVR